MTVTRDMEHRVKQAIARQPGADPHAVWPTVDGGVVTLHGSVHAFSERQGAERAARATAGVTTVRNHILVLPARG